MLESTFVMSHDLPMDAEGRDLKVGDWVRVIAVPLSIRGMPPESLSAFSRAVGHTFQIEAFDNIGCLQLNMYPKISCDSIYIEPFCVNRFRRYKKVSKSFKRTLETLHRPKLPRLGLKFEAIVKSGVDLESFGLELITLGTGGGFAIWPKERRISGSIYVEQSNPEAHEILKKAKSEIRDCKELESLELSDVQLEKKTC